MINLVWMAMLVGGIFVAGITGKTQLITQCAIGGAQQAVEVSFKLIGVMCLWLGIMKIAEEAGLIGIISRLMGPFVRFFFPDVPKNHPAMGAIVITISANMLGLGNAVTPLGIKAMQELQKLNPHKDTATPAMCTLLALCTAGFTMIPASIIAIRYAAGSLNPASIIGTTLITSSITTVVVLIADMLCRTIFARR